MGAARFDMPSRLPLPALALLAALGSAGCSYDDEDYDRRDYDRDREVLVREPARYEDDYDDRPRRDDRRRYDDDYDRRRDRDRDREDDRARYDIPRDAVVVANGAGPLAHTAERDGRIFVRDIKTGKVIYEGRIGQGQKLTIDRRVAVDGRTVRGELGVNREREVFFRPDRGRQATPEPKPAPKARAKREPKPKAAPAAKPEETQPEIRPIPPKPGGTPAPRQ